LWLWFAIKLELCVPVAQNGQYRQFRKGTQFFLNNLNAFEVLMSTYTVCHYTPQGNILGQISAKYQPRSNKYCSTYSNWSGVNKCWNARYSNCMGMSEETSCGCTDVTQKLFNRKIIHRLLDEISNKTVSVWKYIGS
jgi:hypothetical protein